MLPTERANVLIPGIVQALDQLRRALAQGVDFDPLSATGRRFTVATSDYADIVLMPRVMALLRSEAPDVVLRVTRLNRDSIYEQLDQSAIDLAIGGLLELPKRILQQPLYQESFVCIGDSRHMRHFAANLDLETYLGFAHALYVPSDNGSTSGVIDAHLTRLGRERRVMVTFAHIAALPHVVLGTDLVATVAARAARRMVQKGTAVWTLPPELQDTAFGIDMVYGRRSENDPAARWLRSLVERAANR